MGLLGRQELAQGPERSIRVPVVTAIVDEALRHLFRGTLQIWIDAGEPTGTEREQ